MDWLNTVLSAAGSIASILGLFLAIKNQSEKGNKILFGLLFGLLLVLSASTSFFSYQYTKSVDEKLNVHERKMQLKKEAKELLKKAPSYISLYEPGENEGVVFSLLTLMEMNKDIIGEDTYRHYQRNVLRRIDQADTVDVFERREIMESVGKSARQLLKSLSE